MHRAPRIPKHVQMYFNISGLWHTLPETTQMLTKYAAVGLPFVMTAMIWDFPAAICYYWTCSNTYSLVADMILRIPHGVCRNMNVSRACVHIMPARGALHSIAPVHPSQIASCARIFRTLGAAPGK
jgi:hypothetical protein